ncbi:tetratricopeptide repeat protein [Aestuariispira insulae]|uniref:Tetratricopeptide repeat protein n=1 Tax=Aestuariispira insulae TaxID=1461337 RepID=A0A3D9HSJ8_9PROT|nr:hypothetical protein [Aestuariispira insulae]RED52467.1 hypothetical protein DFP90_102488 [Aestuariispira insulae]
MTEAKGIRKGLLGLLLPAAALLAADFAFAQEAVRTRGWAHSDFGRLVFDWPAAVGFEVDAANQQLTVRFDRTLESSFGAVQQQLSDYLVSGEIVENGRAVRFQLKQPVRVNSFANGNSVVVDLRPGQDATPQAPQATQTTQAAPALGVRVGEHPTFDRLVFDWIQPVTYQSAKQGGSLTVEFNRPASINLANVRGQLPAGVSNPQSEIRDGRTRFSLQIPENRTVRHFKSGEKVVIDILKGEAPAVAGAQTVSEGPIEPVAETSPTAEQPVASTDEEAAASPPGTAEGEPSSNASADNPLSLTPPVPEASPVGEVTADPQIEGAPAGEQAAEASEEAVLSEEERARQEEERLRIEAEDEAAQQAAIEGNLNLNRPGDLSVRDNAPDEEGPAPVSLTFSWPEDVGAAVFRRDAQVWIVFDRKATIDLAPLRQRGQPLIERIEQYPNTGATVLGLRTQPGINPIAKREGFDWVIDFRKKPIRPRNQMTIEATTDADVGPQLLFPTTDPGGLINLFDPNVGDTLRIAAFKEPGYGIRGRRVYPEFTILPSAQGLVVQPAIDDLLLDRDLNGFQLTSPDGLHISAVSPEAPVSSGPELSARRLFDLESWKHGEYEDYLEAEQALYRAITEVPVEKINDARMDLARFYIARQRGPEAMGVIKVIEGEEPNIATRPEFRALRGAAKFLNRDYQEALGDLNDPRLNGFAEIAVWRGAALAETEQWQDAENNFKSGDSLLLRYPYPLRGRLGLLRVESALVNRSLQSADSWLKELDRKPDLLQRGQLAALRFYQARVAFTYNDLDTADLLWRDLAEGKDWKYSVLSQYALVNMNLKQGVISKEEATETLDHLSYQWRGDGFELQVLRRLGEIYIQDNDYMNGLGAMRTAVTYFGEDPIAQGIRANMLDIFRRLYLDGEADRLPPLRALAIFDAFRELTPAGPDGDLMLEKLADRLIAVDLLSRAATLLEHQLKNRLVGEEKARVGAKLALIRLIDGDPQGALAALAATSFPELDRELEDDRRRLKAKASYENGDIDEAIKLLAGDISIEADMLRRDIYWNEENWAEVAKVLQRLAGDPPEEAEVGMTDEKARFVLNWAVALLLNSDDDGIALLNDLYGPAMNNSSYASTYRFIATPVESGNTAKLQDTIQQLANSDMFNAFMNNYRDKLLATPTSPGGDGLEDFSPQG